MGPPPEEDGTAKPATVDVRRSGSQESESMKSRMIHKTATSSQEGHQALAMGLHVSSESSALSQSARSRGCVCIYVSPPRLRVNKNLSIPIRQQPAPGRITKRSLRVPTCHPSQRDSVSQPAAKGRPLTNSPRDLLDGPHVCVYLSVSRGSKSRAPSNPLKATIRNQERRRAPASGQRSPSESSALSHISCTATVSRVHDHTPVPPASGPSPAGTGAGKLSSRQLLEFQGRCFTADSRGTDPAHAAGVNSRGEHPALLLPSSWATASPRIRGAWT